MRIPSIVSLLFAVSLAACGSATSPPDDVSSFRLVKDGTPLSFDKFDVTASHGTGGAAQLTFTASSGCGAAIDGCTAFTLTLDLDTNAITASAPAAIDGTTTYTLDPTHGLYPSTFARATGGSPAVQNVGLMENCSPCSANGTYSQTFTGDLSVSSISSSRVAGNLHMGLTGKIPNDWDTSSTVTVDATFDVEVK